jgi:hypothetical protein
VPALCSGRKQLEQGAGILFREKNSINRRRGLWSTTKEKP